MGPKRKRKAPGPASGTGRYSFAFDRPSWQIADQMLPLTSAFVAPGGFFYGMTNKVSGLNKAFPTTDATLRRLRSLYRHWNWTVHDGYIRYSLGSTCSLYEHRLMAEVLYGRNVEKYHVHHKDGHGTNNDGNNLEVLDPSTHARIHMIGRHSRNGKTPATVMRECAFCGRQIEKLARKVNAYTRSFCNAQCYASYRASNNIGGKRFTKPPEQEVLAHLIESHSNEEIASMYGCLKYTVSRWITKYGLARSRRLQPSR